MLHCFLRSTQTSLKKKQALGGQLCPRVKSKPRLQLNKKKNRTIRKRKEKQLKRPRNCGVSAQLWGGREGGFVCLVFSGMILKHFHGVLEVYRRSLASIEVIPRSSGIVDEDKEVFRHFDPSQIWEKNTG